MRYRINSSRLDAREEMPPPRCCDWPTCSENGTYRAPRSPRQADDYRWFCLAHVRMYNRSWNYYDGMSEAEIDADRRSDMVWRRPTWRYTAHCHSSRFRDESIRDDFGLFSESSEPPRRTAVTPEEKAMMVLELTPPVTVTVVKARYKELVKRHHPDANGGDKEAEERFKVISAAYRTVLDTLTT